MIDLGKVDTTRPVPASGSYIATFVDMEIKPAASGKGDVAHVKFALTNPCESAPNSQGKTVTLPAGYQVMDFYTMWTPDGMTDPWTVKFAKLYDAATGTDNSTRPETPDFSTIRGATVVLTLDTKYDDKIDGLAAKVKKVARPTQ